MPDRKLRIGILGDPKDVHVQRWCLGLAARGLRVCLLCGRSPSRRLPGIGYLELRVPAFGLRHPHRRSVRLRHRFQELFGQLDLIHMHNLHNWGIDRAGASRGRLVVSTYGADVLPPLPPPAGTHPLVDRNEHTGKMKKLALALADHITATSAFLAEATSAYGGIPRHQIEVINFGVDPELFAPRRVGRTAWGCVGYCGGFRPVKGAREFIQAAPLVWERFPRCTFELYGSGHNRDQLEALVKRRGHDQAIRFHDSVPHHELPRALDDFDVLAVPSTNVQESYCVLAVEAQAMEVPVVASRIGGLPDTVRDGQTGLLVEHGSPQALADGICELLGDEPRRRALGRAARRWAVSQHNWSDCLDRMIAAYRRVMEGYSRRKTAADAARAPDYTPGQGIPAPTA